MNDDQMDELLIQGARDYNEPGPVPREDMWAAIAAARRAGGAAGGRRGGQAAGRVPRRLWIWPSVGIAAAALLAVGVMLGRRLERQSAATPSLVAQNPVVAKPTADSTPAPAPDTVVKALRDETRKTDSEVRRLVAAAPGRPDAGPPGPPSAEPSVRPNANLAYRLVVLRHLAGSEALITTFRASAKRGEMDAQIAQWSRELLSTTRLLEASAAADDPVMKRLLEDLDLIIAQIAQYAARGTNNPEELDLIEQSIKQRGVIAEMRSVTPLPSPSAHM